MASGEKRKDVYYQLNTAQILVYLTDAMRPESNEIKRTKTHPLDWGQMSLSKWFFTF